MGNAIEKNLGGRPLKLRSAKKVQAIVDEYFAKCESEKLLITVTGLSLALGITRETFLEYAKGEGEHSRLSDLFKKARLRVEHAYEKRGLTAQNPAFCIFIMKNMGYTDRQDIDINAKLRPSSYTEEEEAELREFAKLRALAETTKALTGDNKQ